MRYEPLISVVAVAAGVLILAVAPAVFGEVPVNQDLIRLRQDIQLQANDGRDNVFTDKAVKLIRETPLAFPYTINRAVRDYATYDWGNLILRGHLAYNDYEYGRTNRDRGDSLFARQDNGDDRPRGDDGSAWTAVAAYQRPYGKWGFGIVIPEELYDPQHGDRVLFEGAAPYIYYNVNDKLRVGGLVTVDYAFSDDNRVDDELSSGVGAFAAYNYSFTEKYSITPIVVANWYDSGQEGWDNSLIVTAGARLDFALTDKLSLQPFSFYTTDTEKDRGDDDFWEAGVGLNYDHSDKLQFGAGVATIEDFDRFDSKQFRVSLGLRF